MHSDNGEKGMTSIRYKLYVAKIRMMKLKKLFALPGERLVPVAKKINERRSFKIPKNTLAHYKDQVILGKYHCLTVQAKAARSQKAVLFIYGGGMMFGPGNEDVKLAADMANKLQADVWFPYYPLCTDYPVTEANAMVFECYKEMLKLYKPEHISFVGFSAGAGLAMGICLHNNALGKSLPMPRKIIACSPGVLPMSEEALQKMWALNDKDNMLDASFMTTLRPLMERGEKVPDYMLSAICGDFSDLPPIHFYYGENEILRAEAENFEKVCKKYHVPYTMTIEPNMGHYYALQPQYPEGKKAYQEILGLLRV